LRFTMDIDPLGDSVPPRHAVESDEEEDEYNPLPRKPNASTVVDVQIMGHIQAGKNIILATGDAAKFWARGASLGEQTGGVYVNKVEVGLVFNPSWTSSTIVISEVTTRLPLWAMHKFSKYVIDTLSPPSVALLDTYPVPSYITAEPVYDAPLRYLSTGAVNPSLTSIASTFAPPNLIHSTSAAFMAILAISPQKSKGILILLPSNYIPHPPPRIIEPSNFSHLSEDRVDWPQETIETAQELLFATVGEHPNITWKSQGENRTSGTLRSRQVGETWMYI